MANQRRDSIRDVGPKREQVDNILSDFIQIGKRGYFDQYFGGELYRNLVVYNRCLFRDVFQLLFHPCRSKYGISATI